MKVLLFSLVVEAMTTYDIRNNRKNAQDNNLSTDEILSIVKKNQKKFSKETTISGKISNLFKRQPLKELALDPNIEKSKNDELNENNSADELDSIEKDIKSEIEEEEKDQEKEKPRKRNV